MPKIDTTIPDNTWTAVCRTLSIPENESDLRDFIGEVFGRYRADIEYGGDIKPADVKKALNRCADGAEAFKQGVCPLLTNSDNATVIAAELELILGSGLNLFKLNEIMMYVAAIEKGCREGALKYAVRGGPVPQNSRDLLILRLARVLVEHQIIVSDPKFMEILKILMTAAGTEFIPVDDSLEVLIRRIRSKFGARVNREQPSQNP